MQRNSCRLSSSFPLACFSAQSPGHLHFRSKIAQHPDSNLASNSASAATSQELLRTWACSRQKVRTRFLVLEQLGRMRFRGKEDTEDVGVKPQDLARSSAPVNPQPRCGFTSLFRASSSRGASEQYSRGPVRRTSPTKRKVPQPRCLSILSGCLEPFGDF